MIEATTEMDVVFIFAIAEMRSERTGDRSVDKIALVPLSIPLDVNAPSVTGAAKSRVFLSIKCELKGE